MVTIDESWVSHFMPETKVQSKEWSEPGAKPPRKAKRVESKKKLLYVLFFDTRGAIYQHFVPKVRVLLLMLLTRAFLENVVGRV